MTLIFVIQYYQYYRLSSPYYQYYYYHYISIYIYIYNHCRRHGNLSPLSSLSHYVPDDSLSTYMYTDYRCAVSVCLCVSLALSVCVCDFGCPYL